jgi:hypothetical protein
LKYSYTKYTRRQDAITAMKPIRKMPMMAAGEGQRMLLSVYAVLVEVLTFFPAVNFEF